MDWALMLQCLPVAVLAIGASAGLAVAIWSFAWPSVKGIVEVSFADATMVSGDIRESHQLAYQYEVGGVAYLGGNVKPWGNFNWQLDTPGHGRGFWREEIIWSQARDNAKWYRPGVTVQVYYCPFRPQWCCLEPGGFLLPIMLGAVAAVFYLVIFS